MLEVTAAVVIFAHLLDKLDGMQASTLLIRMDLSIRVNGSS